VCVCVCVCQSILHATDHLAAVCFLPKGNRMREKILLAVSWNNFLFIWATRWQRNAAAGALRSGKVRELCVCVCVCACVWVCAHSAYFMISDYIVSYHLSIYINNTLIIKGCWGKLEYLDVHNLSQSYFGNKHVIMLCNMVGRRKTNASIGLKFHSCVFIQGNLKSQAPLCLQTSLGVVGRKIL